MDDRATLSEEERVPEIEALAAKVAQLSASADFWNRAMLWALAGAAVAAIFIVITTRLAIVRTSQASDVQAELEKAKHNQVALELKNKDVKISDLNRDAELLRQSNLTLQTHLAVLQQQSEARRLTGDQKVNLVRLLLSPPNTEAVAIVSPIADGEANDLADDLDSVFKAAHWNTARIANRITNNFGLSVVTVEGTALPREKRVSDALTAIGISHNVRKFKDGDASTSPAFQSGHLYIVVEHKPLPKANKVKTE